jgi:hypothetical protein
MKRRNEETEKRRREALYLCLSAANFLRFSRVSRAIALCISAKS